MAIPCSVRHLQANRILAVALVAGLLAALAGAPTSAGAAPPPLDSGIRGVVSISPTCPVESVPPDPQCRPRPFATTIEIRDASTRRLVRTVRSTVTGRFFVRLRPALYRIVLRPGRGIALPVRFPSAVRVVPHKFSFARIEYDSGIR
jgi:hypothetical protein